MLVWLFLLYSCCWQVCSKGLCFPFWAGCRMRLLRDGNRKPRDLLGQPGLKHSRAFPFLLSPVPFLFFFSVHPALLLKGCYCASLLGSPAAVAAVTLPLWAAQQVPALSLSLQPCPSSAQPLPALRLFTDRSLGCSQDTPQCHGTDRNDFFKGLVFLFYPLCLPSLWPQPPWAWNMANIKSGWWIYWMHSYGHLAVTKAPLGREEMSSAEQRSADNYIHFHSSLSSTSVFLLNILVWHWEFF